MNDIKTDDEIRDDILDDVAEACYTIYPNLIEGMEEVVANAVSFKALVGGYLYLYEKYKGYDERARLH